MWNVTALITPSVLARGGGWLPRGGGASLVPQMEILRILILNIKSGGKYGTCSTAFCYQPDLWAGTKEINGGKLTESKLSKKQSNLSPLMGRRRTISVGQRFLNTVQRDNTIQLRADKELRQLPVCPTHNFPGDETPLQKKEIITMLAKKDSEPCWKDPRWK